jgi:hypothetical protein
MYKKNVVVTEFVKDVSPPDDYLFLCIVPMLPKLIIASR